MADRLVIRRATLEDYEGVMDIGKIYEGRDYLPAMYDKHLKVFNCYLGEIDGEIVAFNADRLVDAGATITTASARVKEGYQGRGILAAILKHVDDSYTDVKTVKYKAMTCDNINMQLNGERIKRQFTQILERVNLEINGEVTDFKPQNIESDQIKVQELTSEDLNAIFKSKDMCSKLFPGERILPGWHPYRLLPENIPQMMDEFKFWGTKTLTLSTYTTLTVTENYSLGKKLVFKLCVYGSDGIDIRLHVLKHIQDVNILIKGGTYTSIMIDVSHPLNCQDTGTFLSIFEKCGLKIDENCDVNKMVLLEREIK